MTDSPIIFRWTGEAMEPLPRLAKRCDERFVVGETYPLVEQEERSQRSHSHYFAALHDAWFNLPDALAIQFPTVEHLRKAALIATGHFDERRFFASSPAEARKIAAFLNPMDEFSVVSVAGNAVVERKAKSQSRKAMGGPTFQKSKQDCLEWVAEMIGVSVRELAANAEQAA